MNNGMEGNPNIKIISDEATGEELGRVVEMNPIALAHENIASLSAEIAREEDPDRKELLIEKLFLYKKLLDVEQKIEIETQPNAKAKLKQTAEFELEAAIKDVSDRLKHYRRAA